MRDVIITQEPVELFKILKFENLVNSGGEAKMAIEQGYVMVNNQQETRKRRKIVSGDCVEFNQQRLNIVLA